MIKKILGIVFIVLIIFIPLWYYFTFKYVPKGEEFDIKYSDVKLLSSEGSPNMEKAEIRSYGLYTRTNFNVSGDKLYYTFKVTNDGTLDAKLKYDPIYVKTDMYFKKHIKYRISYLDDEQIKAGDELKSGESKTIKVSIEYTSTDTPTQNSQFYESLAWLVYVRK